MMNLPALPEKRSDAALPREITGNAALGPRELEGDTLAREGKQCHGIMGKACQ